MKYARTTVKNKESGHNVPEASLELRSSQYQSLMTNGGDKSGSFRNKHTVATKV